MNSFIIYSTSLYLLANKTMGHLSQLWYGRYGPKHVYFMSIQFNTFNGVVYSCILPNTA